MSVFLLKKLIMPYIYITGNQLNKSRTQVNNSLAHSSAKPSDRLVIWICPLCIY